MTVHCAQQLVVVTSKIPRVQGDQVRMVLAIYVFPNIHTAMNAFCPKKDL